MTNKQLIPLSFLLFFTNPVLAILVLAVHGFNIGNKTVNNANQKYIILLGVLCCIFVSLVNMTKVPESDLRNYVYMYNLAYNYDFKKYLLIAPNTMSYKDPVYHGSVWIMYKIFQGNVNLFLFTISLIEYLPSVLALIYFGKKIKMRYSIVVTGIMLLCFIPYIFLHTMNIIRQTIANSLLCYVMVRHFFYDKREWISMLAMVLIHSTSALFLPVLLFPAFGKSFKKAWPYIIGIIILMTSFQLFAGQLLEAGDFSEESTVGVALTSASGHAAGNYGLTTPLIILVVIMLIYSVLLYLGMILPNTEGLKRFSFAFIYVSVFIILYLGEGLWASRFFHYWFTLVPFILMTAFQKWRIDNLFLLVISFGMLIFWSVFLYTGNWTYEIPLGPWLTPVPVYFFN